MQACITCANPAATSSCTEEAVPKSRCLQCNAEVPFANLLLHRGRCKNLQPSEEPEKQAAQASPAISTCFDGANASSDGSAALRAELEALKMSALMRRAREVDVDETELENAQDGDTPKPSIIELIIARVGTATSPVAPSVDRESWVTPPRVDSTASLVSPRTNAEDVCSICLEGYEPDHDFGEPMTTQYCQNRTTNHEHSIEQSTDHSSSPRPLCMH